MSLVETVNICGRQTSADTYQCLECNMNIDDCGCIWDPDTHEVDIFCLTCDLVHTDVSVEDLIAHNWDEDYGKDENYVPDILESIVVGNPSYRFCSKCRHFNHPLEFPDGTTVYASSEHQREIGEATPDFGLYLSNMWDASCLAYYVDWPDMDVPRRYDIASYAIIDAFKKARDDEMWVEIGCIGGHGRTGTALACMGVLSGQSGQEAIDYVKENYCNHAIETKTQEWFVHWFYAFINGGESTPERVWDDEKKEFANGRVYKFAGPFHWDDYEITQFPKGAPELDTQWVEYDRYIVRHFETADGKMHTTFIDEDDKQMWQAATEMLVTKTGKNFDQLKLPFELSLELDEDPLLDELPDQEGSEDPLEVESVEGPGWAAADVF